MTVNENVKDNRARTLDSKSSTIKSKTRGIASAGIQLDVDSGSVVIVVLIYVEMSKGEVDLLAPEGLV